MDADLRKPRVHKYCNCQTGFGCQINLSIHRIISLMHSIDQSKNLFALTSGGLPPNPSELLGSDKMGEISISGDRI